MISIRHELKQRIRRAWKRVVFRVRVHWHAVQVADALHDIEDEAAIYLLHVRTDPRAAHALKTAQTALIECGRGVKGWD